MPFIELVHESEDMPNHAAAFATRPGILAAWQQLNGAIKETMDLRRYELATIAAARRLRSSYCMLAHGSVLAENSSSRRRARIALDHRSAGLDPVDVAVMDLAEKVAGDATSVTEEDVERLRAFGLDDADIVSVVGAAAARCFFSKTIDALGVQPDASYASVEPELREALVVGRPIEPGSRPRPRSRSTREELVVERRALRRRASRSPRPPSPRSPRRGVAELGCGGHVQHDRRTRVPGMPPDRVVVDEHLLPRMAEVVGDHRARSRGRWARPGRRS